MVNVLVMNVNFAVIKVKYLGSVGRTLEIEILQNTFFLRVGQQRGREAFRRELGINDRGVSHVFLDRFYNRHQAACHFGLRSLIGFAVTFDTTLVSVAAHGHDMSCFVSVSIKDCDCGRSDRVVCVFNREIRFL